MDEGDSIVAKREDVVELRAVAMDTMCEDDEDDGDSVHEGGLFDIVMWMLLTESVGETGDEGWEEGAGGGKTREVEDAGAQGMGLVAKAACEEEEFCDGARG